MKNHNIAINVKIELERCYPYSVVEEGHVKECQYIVRKGRWAGTTLVEPDTSKTIF